MKLEADAPPSSRSGRVRTTLHRAVIAVAASGLAAVVVAAAVLPSQEHALSPVAGAHGSMTASDATARGQFELTVGGDPSAPVHWLGCRPIDFRINPAHEPKGMDAVVRKAMATIGRQTGVRFHDAGSTTHTFDSTGHASTPTIYVAFTSRTRVSGQTFGWPGEIGVGGPNAVWTTTPSGGRFESMVSGRVLLSTKFHGPRTGSGTTWEALIMHEVGHALNLAHRTPTSAVMHATLTAHSPAEFAPSEVRALKRVLQTSRCDYDAWSEL